MQDLDGRVAVITGAASGIGLGMARVFSPAGLAIALCDVNADTLNAAVAEITAAGGKACGFCFDVADRAAADRAADDIEAAFGRIHILINNAGVLLRGRTVEDVPLADCEWIIGVNLYGPINDIQAFLPRIRKHGQGGHVVNTASISGFLVTPGRRTAPYQATKFAVVALSKSLHSDLAGTGIGVSMLAPAGVKSAICRASPSPSPCGGRPLASRPMRSARASSVPTSIVKSGTASTTSPMPPAFPSPALARRARWPGRSRLSHPVLCPRTRVIASISMAGAISPARLFLRLPGRIRCKVTDNVYSRTTVNIATA